MAADEQLPLNKAADKPPVPPPSSSSSTAPEWKVKGASYPNPPDATNPDPLTLRDQWRFATRQYARWYSHAWGTAILAGVSFFALGWLIKGSNPLPSRSDHHPPPLTPTDESTPSSATTAASTE